MTTIPAPFDAYRDVVRREWIDHNQHMNMGYYLVVFVTPETFEQAAPLEISAGRELLDLEAIFMFPTR